MRPSHHSADAPLDDETVQTFVSALEILLDPDWSPSSGRPSPLVHAFRALGTQEISPALLRVSVGTELLVRCPGLLAGLRQFDDLEEEERLDAATAFLAGRIYDELLDTYRRLVEDDGHDDDPPPKGGRRSFAALVLQLFAASVVVRRARTARSIDESDAAEDFYSALVNRNQAVIRAVLAGLRGLPRLRPGMGRADIQRTAVTCARRLRQAVRWALIQTMNDRDPVRLSLDATLNKTFRGAAVELELWVLTTPGTLLVGAPQPLGRRPLRWSPAPAAKARSRAPRGPHEAWGRLAVVAHGDGVQVGETLLADGEALPLAEDASVEIDVPAPAWVSILETDRPGFMGETDRKAPLRLRRCPRLRSEALHPHVYQTSTQPVAIPHTLLVGAAGAGCTVNGTPLAVGHWRAFAAAETDHIDIDAPGRVVLARPGRFRRRQEVRRHDRWLKPVLLIEALDAAPGTRTCGWEELERSTRHIGLPNTFVATGGEGEDKPETFILYAEAVLAVVPRVALADLRRLIHLRVNGLAHGIPLAEERDDEGDATPSCFIDPRDRAVSVELRLQLITEEFARRQVRPGVLRPGAIAEICAHPVFQQFARRYAPDEPVESLARQLARVLLDEGAPAVTLHS